MHFADADSINEEYSIIQEKQFKDSIKKINDS
jgi:hypothetical protein